MADTYIPETLVPTSFAEPYGYLMVWFGMLEEQIDLVLGALLDLDPERGDLVAAQFTSISLKLDLIESLTEKRSMGAIGKSDLAEALDLARNANDARNGVVHGRWKYSLASLLNPEMGIKKESRTRAGKIRPIPVTKEGILRAAKTALKAAKKFEALVQSLRGGAFELS